MRAPAPGLRWLLVAAHLACASAVAVAQSANQEGQPAPGPQDAIGSRGPSLEFLEFLGEWETGDGEWLDPMELPFEHEPAPSADAADTEGAEIDDVR